MAQVGDGNGLNFSLRQTWRVSTLTPWRVLGLIVAVSILLAAECRLITAELQTTGNDTFQCGAYSTSFTRRSPFSRLATLQKLFRFKCSPNKPASEYDLSKESYEVYVPESYQPGVPYGLIVWINAVDYGTAFEQWRSVLDKRFLIWVGANDSGNRSSTYRRIGLALDAAVNMTQRYTVDKQRIYVAGFSGGGRVASIVTMTYPKIFQGGLFLCGANYFRDIRGLDGKVWYGKFPLPPKLARSRSRYVLLTGDLDFNLKNTQAVFNGYQQDRFRYATYLQVPGHNHEIPNAEWFEKGIAALDQPLAKSASKSLRLAVGLQLNKKYGRALLEYTKAYVHGMDQAFAAEALSKANAIRDQYQQEIDKVTQMIQDKQDNQATAVLRRIKLQYQKIAQSDYERLNKQIREQRKTGKR